MIVRVAQAFAIFYFVVSFMMLRDTTQPTITQPTVKVGNLGASYSYRGSGICEIVKSEDAVFKMGVSD